MRALLTISLLAISLLTTTLAPASAFAAEKYDGPRPPQPDLLYLVHADNLVPTEAIEAKQESAKKDETVYYVSGTGSEARTPLAEPIFLIKSEKVIPDRLEMYKMDVKSGRREITMSKGRRSKGPKALRLTVTRLEGGLYKVEASEPLENGQYSISPSDSNKVFCFEIY
jgi:hypothetical protein